MEVAKQRLITSNHLSVAYWAGLTYFAGGEVGGLEEAGKLSENWK